jgi:hypothetical protein
LGVGVKDRLTTVQGSRVPRPVVNPAVETVVWVTSQCFKDFFFIIFFMSFAFYVWIENAFDGLHSVWLRFVHACFGWHLIERSRRNC